MKIDDGEDLRGLSAAQAAQALAQDGPNELTPPQRRTVVGIALEAASEPMFQLLVAAGALYLLLGDVGEALMLLGFVVMTVVITVVQGRRTEKALEALRDLSSPRALVVRDGQTLRVAGREVVRGDLLVLTEGDRIAADARLLSASDLQVDESLLTGEAVPVRKLARDDAAPITRPGGADLPFVFAGSMIVSGQGLARVLATGTATEIGRIGQALGAITPPPTPLTLQTRRLVRIVASAGLALSLVVVLLHGLLYGDWIAGALAGITLAMAILPEEFGLILTVFMAMGAWRLSRQQVLTRRAATIEALGAATVLCTDKTGTLTWNRMAIAELVVPVSDGMQTWADDRQPLPQAFHDVIETGMLASERDPFDPMDKAFLAFGRERLPPLRTHDDWTLVHEFGLSADLMAMTHVWHKPAAQTHEVAIKGALEAVLPLCHLAPDAASRITSATQGMAARGLRVLALAHAQYASSDWPATPHGFDFDFVGLVGLADPLRDGVQAAVQECRSAGIRVVMITGDHPVTASAIAAQAGIDGTGDVMTGAELAALGAEELRARVATTTVFARVLPEQKLRIVEALQAQGEVVAMTGDGVNDAPSLKAAHIGIAMGGRGTDVAREASSLVLLDDDFGSIVRAMRQGRRIFDNLRKAMAFVFAVHVPIAGLSLLPLLVGLPAIFTPVHIAFLELLIDPVCSIAFESEAEEADVMARPPRNPAEPLFTPARVIRSLLQGTVALLAVGAWFVTLLRSGLPEAQARAASFTALVLCSVMLIIANRSLSQPALVALRRPNPALWRMLAVTAVLLAAVLFVAPLRALFRFGLPPAPVLAGSAAVALGVLLVLEAGKRLWQRP